jgi:hypothetical protein
MESIKSIYRIGNGPSSSHTMGPKKALNYFVLKIRKQQRSGYICTEVWLRPERELYR